MHKIEFNYYNTEEIIEEIEKIITITPQLKSDIRYYRKPIPKTIINKIHNKWYLDKEHNKIDYDNFDKYYGLYYSCLLSNGRRKM